VALGLLVAIGYWKLTHDHQEKVIQELSALNAQLETRLAERKAMIERLSRTRRVAHVQVVEQKVNESGKIAETSIQFIELDDAGSELARQSFTLPGDVLFIDAWTVKFDHEQVAQGSPLMGRTMVLLKRVYSDQMKPADGIAIDTPGAVPPGYAATEQGTFEKRIWENFWSLATDLQHARELGVRVAQGEAVYKPVRAGQTYELIVDASGGISLTPLGPGPDGEAVISRAQEL
jgi:hypothetical protein